MKLGVAVRSMGPQSAPAVLAACARAAEAAGLADLWVQDHIAIPPDDAEGSGGRYLDPLSALAWLAGQTGRIGLGTGVLILPYRPALPTAKAVATVQELSGGRLRLGVGVGWMDAEFRALGVPRDERGARSDAVLDLLDRAFASDVVREHGQDFLFLPRPQRPPLYVGGKGDHALRRAARHGDGWFAMGGEPAELARANARMREMVEEEAAAGRRRADRADPVVLTFTAFDPSQPEAAPDRVAALAEAGVDHLVAGVRYADAAGFQRHADFLAERVLSLDAFRGT